MRVVHRLILGDLVLLKEWIPEVDWRDVPVRPGCYAVTLNGFRQRSSSGKIIRAGFDIVLRPTDGLPKVTGDLSRSMRVF